MHHLQNRALDSLPDSVSVKVARPGEIRPLLSARGSTVKNDSSYSFRFNEMARPAGLEPAAPWFEARCSIQLSYGRTVHRLLSIVYRSFFFDFNLESLCDLREFPCESHPINSKRVNKNDFHV
jgi:hypothetical protein